MERAVVEAKHNEKTSVVSANLLAAENIKAQLEQLNRTHAVETHRLATEVRTALCDI